MSYGSSLRSRELRAVAKRPASQSKSPAQLAWDRHLQELNNSASGLPYNVMAMNPPGTMLRNCRQLREFLRREYSQKACFIRCTFCHLDTDVDSWQALDFHVVSCSLYLLLLALSRYLIGFQKTPRMAAACDEIRHRVHACICIHAL